MNLDPLQLMKQSKYKLNCMKLSSLPSFYKGAFVLPVHAAAIQAEDGAEAHGRPLRIFHAAVAALVVSRQRLHDRLVGGGHLHHVLIVRFRYIF